MAWECFRDPCYYDMWCVRLLEHRKFGQGFHVSSEDEALALRNLLNAQGTSASGQDRNGLGAKPAGPVPQACAQTPEEPS